jgi:hypothetical protein
LVQCVASKPLWPPKSRWLLGKKGSPWAALFHVAFMVLQVALQPFQGLALGKLAGGRGAAGVVGTW